MDVASNPVLLPAYVESETIVLEDARRVRPMIKPFYGAAWDAFEKLYNQAHKVEKKTLMVPNWQCLKKMDRGHACSEECLEGGIFEAEDHKLAEYRVRSPYLTPTLLGWTRAVVGEQTKKVQYTAPCGRECMDIAQETSMDMYLPVRLDMFSFDERLRPEVLLDADHETVRLVDFSWNKEPMPIRVVNAVDDEKYPKMVVYVPERSIMSKPLDAVTMQEMDLEKFRTCCDCEDNCADPEKCQCQLLTKEKADRMPKSVRPKSVLYDLRTLTAQVRSGIFECNEDCGCYQELNALEQPTCNNRVAQYGIDVPLELYKVPTVGWALRSLVDLPPGRFLFTYAGAVYATQFVGKLQADDIDPFDLEPSEIAAKMRIEDADGLEVIPDGWTSEQYYASKRKQYVIDAQESGNIARFARYSCRPNMRVQHVFTDTHDVRFPLVGFFTNDYIPAGTPLTWNFGQDAKATNEGYICPCDYCIDHRKPHLKAKLQTARRSIRRSVRYWRPYPPYA